MFPSRLYRAVTRSGQTSIEVLTPGTTQRRTVASLLRRSKATALAVQLQDAYNQGVLDTRTSILPALQQLRDTLDLAACMDQFNPRPGDVDAKGRAQGFGRAVAMLDKIIAGV